jgi:hypothetical protein
MCKEHMINFIEIIDFFCKSRSILIKEKVYNYYKENEEIDNGMKVKLEDILEYLNNDINDIDRVIYFKI